VAPVANGYIKGPACDAEQIISKRRPAYVFTPRQTIGDQAWCIDGDRAQQPTYTRQETP
jgi:hypothetical protein